MYAKSQVAAGFKKKRNIRHRSSDFVSLSVYRIFTQPVIRWFLAYYNRIV